MLGHSPAGSVAIWLLLALGILSGVTGVILFQDIGGDVLEELHEVTSNAMLAVVFFHIAGVVVSSLMHRENLVRSMVTGFKFAEPDEGIRRSYRWLGVIMLVGVVTFWVDYPATGLVTTSETVTQVGQHSHD